MPPSTSGFQSCDVGQQSLYQPPVSTTSRLPSASSSTSVGWKSKLSETRKSSSTVVNVPPSFVSTCRVTLCRLKQQANRLSWNSAPKIFDSYRVRPQEAAGPRCTSGGIRSPVRGWPSSTLWSLPYTPPYTAWIRPSRRPPPGCCKNVVLKIRSPPGV